MSMSLRRRRIRGILAVVALAGIAAGVAAWQYHKQPQFCGLCHIMDPYVEPWISSAGHSEAHAQSGVTCLECHEATIGQQVNELVKFVTSDYKNPLEEREFDQQWCLQCHEHGIYEEVLALTADLEPNPHEPYHGELQCNVCHNVHRESQDHCVACHETALSEPEWMPAPRVPEWWTADWDCAYCHVADSQSMQDAALLASVHAQQGLDCLDCHDLEGLQALHTQAGAEMPVLRESRYPNQFCFECHVSNPHPSYEAIVALTAAYTIDEELVNPHDPHPDSETLGGRQYECQSCHIMHGESPGLDFCNSCHHDRTW